MDPDGLGGELLCWRRRGDRVAEPRRPNGGAFPPYRLRTRIQGTSSPQLGHERLPQHPQRGLPLRPSAPAGVVLAERTYFSIGGGFSANEEERDGQQRPAGEEAPPHPLPRSRAAPRPAFGSRRAWADVPSMSAEVQPAAVSAARADAPRAR
ncbi:hypothetical protein ACRAWD_01595 [Caulobacter segnis]